MTTYVAATTHALMLVDAVEDANWSEAKAGRFEPTRANVEAWKALTQYIAKLEQRAGVTTEEEAKAI